MKDGAHLVVAINPKCSNYKAKFILSESGTQVPFGLWTAIQFYRLPNEAAAVTADIFTAYNKTLLHCAESLEI